MTQEYLNQMILFGRHEQTSGWQTCQPMQEIDNKGQPRLCLSQAPAAKVKEQSRTQVPSSECITSMQTQRREYSEQQNVLPFAICNARGWLTSSPGDPPCSIRQSRSRNLGNMCLRLDIVANASEQQVILRWFWLTITMVYLIAQRVIS